MDYYVRAFCTTDSVPTVRSLLHWLEERDVRLQPAARNAALLDDPAWQRVDLAFHPGKPPIVVECRRDAATPDTPARQEVDGFIARIGSPGASRTKKRVIKHLRATTFLIACQLPVEDMDETAWDANGQILAFFAENCDALLQADNEGFYERSVLILKVT